MNFDPELAEKSLRVLAEQGGADEIAAFLRERGVRGRPFDAASCPVSAYMQSETLADFACADQVQVYCFENPGSRHEFATPPAVAQFITNFDCGRYPALIGRNP